MNSNVDHAEIAKFEALASRWWDKDGEFKPLHEINPLRLGFIKSHAGFLAGKRIVDVGCGGGILSEAMAAEGADVTGIDMGEAPLSVAKLHLLESKRQVNYRRTTVEELAAEQPASFDVVTCMEMIEHVPDPASVVQACAKLVKPNGCVFFSTINRHPKAFLFAIVGAEYVLNMLPKGTHEYAKFIRPSELTQWTREAQLRCTTMTGMHYNPFTKQYKLGDGVDVNYIICTTKESN
jgi:2-polyprenyl-6-hydroxyphenyl methylase/3-demethylubiquinone-9 3-methyltransferase